MCYFKAVKQTDWQCASDAFKFVLVSFFFFFFVSVKKRHAEIAFDDLVLEAHILMKAQPIRSCGCVAIYFSLRHFWHVCQDLRRELGRCSSRSLCSRKHSQLWRNIVLKEVCFVWCSRFSASSAYAFTKGIGNSFNFIACQKNARASWKCDH